MRILPHIYLVGSGRNGVCISDDWDSHAWILDGGDELAFIDVGCGRGLDAILAEMRADGLDPNRVAKILLTHSHADHAGGAAAIHKMTGAQVFVGRAGSDFVKTGNEDAVGLTIARGGGYYPSDYRLSPCPVHAGLADGDVVRVGKWSLKAIETPGHSVDSVCYWGLVDDRSVLWSGDVVQFGDWGQFKGMISLLNAPGCDLASYVSSVQKLTDLEVDALLPSHRLFCVRNGKRQVDCVARALRGMTLPKSVMAAY